MGFPQELRQPSLTISTIDGGQANLNPGDLRWGSRANLGDEALSCLITADEYRANKQMLQFGAPTVLWDGTKPIWVGALDEPAVADDVSLTATGLGVLLDGVTDPLFLQVMDLTIFQSTDSYMADADTNTDLTCSITPLGYMRWASKSTGQGGTKGFVAHYDGNIIKRFALECGSPCDLSDAYYMQIWRVCSKAPDKQFWYREPAHAVALRPTTGQTVEQIYTKLVVTSGHPASGQPGVVNNVTPYDGIAIMIGGSRDGFAGGIVALKNIRANGTITQKDIYTPIELFNLIGAEMNWTGNGQGAVNMLPLWLEEGTARSFATDFAALLSAGSWGVFDLFDATGKPKLNLNIYPTSVTDEDVFEVSSTDGASYRLLPTPLRKNVVKIVWENTAGDPQVTRYPELKVQFSKDFPYEQQETVNLPGQYPPDSLVPLEIAVQIYDLLTAPSYEGTIDAPWVRRNGDLTPGWHVKPGMGLFVPEHQDNPAGGLYLVHATSDDPGGATFQIGPIADLIQRQIKALERERLRDPLKFL